MITSSRLNIFLTLILFLINSPEILSIDGETKINLVIKDKNKEAYYSLQNNRKFDLKHLKALKAKEYVEKITV